MRLSRSEDVSNTEAAPGTAAGRRQVCDAHELLRRALATLSALETSVLSGAAATSLARQGFSGLARTVARVDSEVQRLESQIVQMRHFAYHDELTGLPNRSLFLDRLHQAVAQAARRRGQAAALMLDLDGFKRVNDSFGHAVGDQLLMRVGRRLLASIRDADTTARYGGDEFVVLLPDVEGKDSAAAVARKIQDRLTEPFVISGHRIVTTACVGIARYPSEGVTPEALIERADLAMYAAKDLARRDPTLAGGLDARRG